MAETLRDLTNGTIGHPIATLFTKDIGTLADLINAYSRGRSCWRDDAGMVASACRQSLTLRDLTTGDLGNVLEDISYGMGPMRGGNYATGGLGTLGQMHPQVLELANALPAAAVAGKAIRRAGDILTKKKEANVRPPRSIAMATPRAYRPVGRESGRIDCRFHCLAYNGIRREMKETSDDLRKLRAELPITYASKPHSACSG